MSAAAVIKLKERQGATQRQSLLELRHDEQAFIAQVLLKWADPDRKQPEEDYLKFDEVRKWLDDIKLGDNHATSPDVTPEVVEYVMMEGNRDKADINGHDKTFQTLQKKVIYPEGFGLAVDAWVEFQDVFDEILVLFEKFDLDRDQKLNKKELTVFLTDLNELKPVSEADVDEVLKMSDIVGRGFIVPINLPKTISAWNDLVQRKRQISDPSTQGNTSRGWRCSVS